MKKVLIVEDSTMVLRVIKHVMNQSDLIIPLYAEDFATAKAHVEANPGEIFAALVDLTLPDAPNGEVVDFTLSHNLPTIVLTGSFDQERRKTLLAKGVLDYVTKEGRFSYNYAVSVVHRLIKNEYVQVLVVDDSEVSRNFTGGLLRLQRYQVFEASDGMQAIKILLENPNIKMLITDYNMPGMDGCELIRNIRHKYEKSDLIIIGLSSESDEALSAKFIKVGANDYLHKPFNQEEFYCRVTHNIELLEMIEKIQDSANRDYYTGAYNRHYFFSEGQVLLNQAQEKSVPIAAVVIDLDNFKEINQLYGNEVGDLVMRRVAEQLMQSFERFLFARADGQEFYALLVGLDNQKATAFVEKVRQILSGFSVDTGEGKSDVSVTYSAGVSNVTGSSLDGLLQSAGECLARAKEAGGDLVFGDD